MAIYRALLRLYPKSFRAEYGAEMLKDFNRQWRDLSRGARVGLLFGAAAGARPDHDAGRQPASRLARDAN